MCAIREYFHFNMFKVDTWIHSYIYNLSKLKIHFYLIHICSLCQLSFLKKNDHKSIYILLCVSPRQ